MRTSGLLRRIEPLSVRMLTRLEDGSKTQVNWLPALGWNAHDELLAGFVVHNSVLPLRNWEWMAMPLWSTENATLAGIGRVSFKKGNGRWEGQLRKFATQGIEGVYALDYLRSSVRYLHRFNQNPGTPLSSDLSVSLIDVREQPAGIGIDPGFAPYLDTLRQALRLNYRINSNRGNLKQQGELRITAGGVGLKNWGELIRWAGLFEAPLFPKLTDQSITVEAMWKGRKEVNRKGRGWGWRIYAGKAFGASNVYPLMTAGITGATDNFKDHLFFGREQYDLLSRIIAREQGGLPIMNVLLSSNADVMQMPVNGMVSGRISRNVTKRIHAYGGGLVASNMRLATLGLEMDLRFMKVQLPLVQWLDGFTSLNFKGQTAFSIVLNLEDLSPYQLLRSGQLLN